MRKSLCPSKIQVNFYEEMKHLFISNISKFLNIDSEKTHNFINIYFQDSDAEIIKNLSNKAHLKTDYIEKRLLVKKTNELKLLYLENLSKERNVKKVFKTTFHLLKNMNIDHDVFGRKRKSYDGKAFKRKP